MTSKVHYKLTVSVSLDGDTVERSFDVDVCRRAPISPQIERMLQNYADEVKTATKILADRRMGTNDS